jgi:uncharacterized protein (TIGR02145 family)
MSLRIKITVFAMMLTVAIVGCGSSSNDNEENLNDTDSGLSSDGTMQTIANTKFLVEEPDGYYNYQEASDWCTNKGYRLPTTTELIAVWNANGGSVSPDGFKKDTFYWANNKNSSGEAQGCAMDYDCSEASVWDADSGLGHPKCVVEDTTNTNDTSTITHNSITYNAVVSPYTGKTWLDRNLGATQVCTAIDDSKCYGDYYQWGRNTDGHEKATSSTTSTQASNYANAGSGFIASGYDDWTAGDADGITRSINWGNINHNTICPTGYRVPTFVELKAETIDQSFSDETSMFESFLKVPSSGWRASFSGGMFDEGDYGYLWSSTNSDVYIDNATSEALSFGHGQISVTYLNRTGGYSVRCIKD